MVRCAPCAEACDDSQGGSGIALIQLGWISISFSWDDVRDTWRGQETRGPVSCVLQLRVN